jgi:hypothetical protein
LKLFQRMAVVVEPVKNVRITMHVKQNSKETKKGGRVGEGRGLHMQYRDTS